MKKVRLLDKVEAAWVGATIQGEGYIKFAAYKGRDRPFAGYKIAQIAVGSTDIETISTLLRLTQVGSIGTQTGKLPHHLRMWTWRVNGFNMCSQILEQTYEFLTSKRKTAKEILKYKKVIDSDRTDGNPGEGVRG